MAIRLLSVIGTKIAQVRNEILAGANTKTRVADLLQDAVDSGVFQFDPLKTDGYKQDQLAVFEGVLCQAKVDTNQGETPTTHIDKWERFIITDLSQAITTNGLPVSGKVIGQLKALIDAGINGLVPNADENTFGKVKRASDQAAALGTDKESYVSPFQVMTLINLILDAIKNVIEITLDKALKGGNHSAVVPYFESGINGTLPTKPETVKAVHVVVGPDGKFYKDGSEVIIITPPPVSPPDTWDSFVHYIEVAGASNPITVIVDNNNFTEDNAYTPPIVNNPHADVTITATGAASITFANDEFISYVGGTSTYFTRKWDTAGNTELPLPNYVSYDNSTGVLLIGPEFPNQTFKIRRRFVDSLNQPIWYDFTIVVDRITAGVQQILSIQTKRTPGVVNNDGIQIRIQTTGGYVPRIAYGKTAYPANNLMNPVPAFADGAYQYGALIVDPPNAGQEFITVGFLTSAGDVAHILINDKSGSDSVWITQYSTN